MSGGGGMGEAAAEAAARNPMREGGGGELAVPRRAGLSKAELDVVRNLFRNSRDQLTDPEIAYVLFEASKSGLHPVKQLAAWRDKTTGKIVLHTKVDGLLAIAERSKQYRGLTPTVLTWRTGDALTTRPMREGPPLPKGDEQVSLVAATVGVLREGYSAPVEVTTYWADRAPADLSNPANAWNRQPATMLEKCAISAALRRAFPQDLAGLYESSELPREE